VSKIRFHLDENVDPVVAAGLRRYGVDVTTTAEVGLRSKSVLSSLPMFVRPKESLSRKIETF
jgi:hypothetical protein